MATEILYKMDLAGVNWAAMKEAVATDNFDNGRTPEQLRRSFENSAVTCIAYAGDELVGTVRALADVVCNAYIVDVWTKSAYRRQGIAHRMMELVCERLPGHHVIGQTGCRGTGVSYPYSHLMAAPCFSLMSC